MNDYMLVADIGTQSLRVSIVSSKGEIVAFHKRKYKTPFLSPKKGYVEQDANYYLNELCIATREFSEDYPEYIAVIKGMSIACIRDSSVILDADKEPLRNAILWLDQRVTRLPGQKNLKWYEKALFKMIGMSDTVKYNAERTITYWLMEHEPENWKKMRWYCPLGAYFNYKITGNLAVSTADCVGHYPINFKKGEWFPKWHPKQHVFSIPYQTLPPLIKVGQIMGEVTEEFSRLSNIPAGTKVLAAASDKSCETFGNGCIDKHSASISLGTACTIEVVDQKYSEPEKFLPSYQAPYPGSYDLEVQIYSGLWMVQWFVENFGYEDKVEAQKQGMTIEEYLNLKIQDIPTGSNGLILQPYWYPGLKRPNARGSIVGYSNIHTRYHLFKAIYEGIGFALREGLDEIMKKTHYKPEVIVLSGGGSKSKELSQIIADIFGISCINSSKSESSTVGCAMAGFLSLGVFSSPKEAKKAMVTDGHFYVPNTENHKIYNRIYNQVYKKMYPSLSKFYVDNKDLFLDLKSK